MVSDKSTNENNNNKELKEEENSWIKLCYDSYSHLVQNMFQPIQGLLDGIKDQRKDKLGEETKQNMCIIQQLYNRHNLDDESSVHAFIHIDVIQDPKDQINVNKILPKAARCFL